MGVCVCDLSVNVSVCETDDVGEEIVSVKCDCVDVFKCETAGV